MSDRAGEFYVFLIIIALMLSLLLGTAVSQIRDLQRRVSVLEQQVYRWSPAP